MNYKFKKLKDILPKKVNRSNRIDKKLHLNEFAETAVDIIFNVNLANSAIDVHEKIFDALYDHDFEFGTFSLSTTEFSILYETDTKDFTEESVKEVIKKLFTILIDVDNAFSKVQDISITHGDAYYGDW